ncbi:AraC family transcriptional regulator [Bradyrhizobium sp. DOA9]|uniref:AraC family transcriptional regulator n=1 Tax=Bradyrhizobium sp. DOA9 TaxID=1126627 RepID=UPI000468BF96|nr:helix-turn-helix domain-containing protein [Bradyrhizobium sp. DOA9]GAJ34011.1 HTH-type transcriptional regulator eutR [Bradyrhizobium sp. DOA9]
MPPLGSIEKLRDQTGKLDAACELRASSVLRIDHFENIEEFRPTGILGTSKTVALDPASSSISRAALALPECRVVLQRSFARESEGDLGAETCGLVIPMSRDHCHTLNGQLVGSDGIVLLRGIVSCRVREPLPNSYALVRMSTAMQTRGWPDFERGIGLFSADAQRMHDLQRVLWNIAQRASACLTSADFARQAADMQETLYAAFDDVLIKPDAIRARPRSHDRHRKYVSQLDDLIRESPNASLYSEDLALALGTSVRTLQTAVATVHGISLHKYIRTRRLWMVRCELARGYPSTNVKAIAGAHGFWHMGDFSRFYKVEFGEFPSETLVQARRYRSFR